MTEQPDITQADAARPWRDSGSPLDTVGHVRPAGDAARQRPLVAKYCMCCGMLGIGAALVAIIWYAMLTRMTPGPAQAGIVIAAFLCGAGIGYLARHNRWMHWGLLLYGSLVFLTFVGCAVALIVHAYVNQPDNMWLGAVFVVACLIFASHGLCGVAAAAYGRALRRHLANAHATHDATACRLCNYDLRGSRHSTTCPECGAPIPIST